MPDGTSRMYMVDKSGGGGQDRQIIYQIFSCSTFSEYTVVDANYVVKLNLRETDSKTLAHASFLSCGYSTGFEAAWKEAKIHKGATVAVFGLGAVGLGGLGTTVLIGAGKEGKVDLQVFSMLAGRTLKGCIFGNLRPKSDLPHLLDKWLNKELNLDELWTEEHQVNLADINNVFKLMKRPDCVKVLIKF